MSDVSRSVYQKLKEENKRLLKDIFVLTMTTFNPEKMIILDKWRNKFIAEREFNELLRQVAKEYIKEHPEFDILKRS